MGGEGEDDDLISWSARLPDGDDNDRDLLVRDHVVVVGARGDGGVAAGRVERHGEGARRPL